MKFFLLPKTPSSRNTLTGLLFCLVVAGLVYYLQSSSAPVSYTFTFDSFVIKGEYGDTIPFAALQQVTLREDPPVNPFKLIGTVRGSILQGVFTTDDLGQAQLYINTAKPPFVLIKTLDRVVLINGKNRAATEELYRKLIEAQKSVYS